MRLSRQAALVGACGVALVVAAPALAITRGQADAIARSALHAKAAGKFAVLHGLPAALPAGAAVSEAGPGVGEAWTVVDVGGHTVLRASVARTKLSSSGWLFWEDPRAGTNFPHASKLLLVDNRTGKVAWLKTIDWWPLVNNKPAAFYAHSNKPAYRVTASTARASVTRFPHDCVVALVDLTDPRPVANFPGDGEAMLALADTYGMKSALTGSISDFVAATDKLIADGCTDVIVLVAGHGTPAAGPGATVEPTVILHTSAVPDFASGGQAIVADEVVTADDLKAFVSQRQGKASFKFLINSCFGGRFVEELADTPGVVLVETASSADEPSVQSISDDQAGDHPLESGTWVAELSEEFRHVVDGDDPDVDPADLAAARSSAAEALAITAEHAHDRAKQLGLTHPVSTGVIASATPETYNYNVTIEAAATGDSFVDGYGVPGTHPTYAGSMSSTFRFTFPLSFTVDPKDKTVAAGSTPGSGAGLNGSGVDSFMLTASDPPQQSDTCTVPAHTAFRGYGSLAPAWGGLPDSKSYAAGVLLFSMSMEADASKIYHCSAYTPANTITVTVESGYTIPGAKLSYVNTPPSSNPSYPNPGCVSNSGPTGLYIPIPLADIGKEQVTTSYNPGPVKCQGTVLGATYTAHVTYLISLERVH